MTSARRLRAGASTRLLRERTEANERFFAAEAERIARLCHRMAERFARGGRLLALGRSPAARSDARHVAVEFVHPVIVGKRALPAHRRSRGEGGDARRAGRAAWPSRRTSRSRFGGGGRGDRAALRRARSAAA